MLLIDDTELLRDRGYIDGAWSPADSGATFPVHDPATGEVLAEVPRMGASETRRAIEAAAAALPAWRARPARERAAFLRAFSDLMLRHRRDLAMIMTREQGKPLAESDAEIGYAASFLEWMGEEAKRVYGDTIPAPQIVTGDAEDAPAIGGELTGNPLVRKIGFTGSTAVGKILMAQCAGQVKKLSLELGGNAPFLVFDDADLDKAVAGAIICKFRNAGQVCIAANRLLVQDGIHDAFVERYAEAITALRVGLGTDQGVNVGPLIDQQGLDKVVAHVADARAKGAEVVLGGGPHPLGGLFYEPTLLTGVSDSMAMSQDETFGPVAGIRRFGDEDEGIRLANDTPYGLAAYFYSRDVGRVWRVGEGLDYGIVGVNTGFVSTEVAPFGGMKESGIGREGSKYGIEDWLEIKYLAMGGIDG